MTPFCGISEWHLKHRLEDAHTVDHLVLVTRHTLGGIGLQVVKTYAVTLVAAQTLHKNMPRVAIRLSERNGTLRCFAVMTLPATGPGLFAAMGLLDISISSNICQQKLIAFNNRYLVAGLAFQKAVLTSLPGIISFLSQVTEGTEGWLVIYVMVIAISSNTPNDGYKEGQDDYALFLTHDVKMRRKRCRMNIKTMPIRAPATERRKKTRAKMA
jgi:hypothetical protein